VIPGFCQHRQHLHRTSCSWEEVHDDSHSSYRSRRTREGFRAASDYYYSRNQNVRGMANAISCASKGEGAKNSCGALSVWVFLCYSVLGAMAAPSRSETIQRGPPIRCRLQSLGSNRHCLSQFRHIHRGQLSPRSRPKPSVACKYSDLLRQRPEEAFPVHKILSENAGIRLVNDCGIRDSVLIFSQAFVLFTGMAGRTGLAGLEGNRFRNRFSTFGHSGYFVQNGEFSDYYMSRYWVPLLTTDLPIEECDERPPLTPFAGAALTILENAEPLKYSHIFLHCSSS
jgi:hypothetical protein